MLLAAFPDEYFLSQQIFIGIICLSRQHVFLGGGLIILVQPCSKNIRGFLKANIKVFYVFKPSHVT